ncbi:uncharacterized protein BDZ83DRAFT_124159 [Colletotrichum acutatum]|uniref:Uncharacterized protein n=1 Tax=Glomerella acutata TaxID=27357 RepID=A0AAD8UBU1_GLOAC|nr:uncharacterized protein BDZ83DRAFT_124159 [Colletotrichum acutatum]KAK1710845.1 hypothetical protein BDZ83DRAFT_124159 [Colletotrichum acutatum]
MSLFAAVFRRSCFLVFDYRLSCWVLRCCWWCCCLVIGVGWISGVLFSNHKVIYKVQRMFSPGDYATKRREKGVPSRGKVIPLSQLRCAPMAAISMFVKETLGNEKKATFAGRLARCPEGGPGEQFFRQVGGFCSELRGACAANLASGRDLPTPLGIGIASESQCSKLNHQVEKNPDQQNARTLHAINDGVGLRLVGKTGGPASDLSEASKVEIDPDSDPESLGPRLHILFWTV